MKQENVPIKTSKMIQTQSNNFFLQNESISWNALNSKKMQNIKIRKMSINRKKK